MLAEPPRDSRSFRPEIARLARIYHGVGLPPTVRRLGLASFFQDVASEMVYPLLPAFLAALGGTALTLGAMESAAEATLALVRGAVGRWSDRVGRRKPFVAGGYGGSALARPLLAAASSPVQVIALRAWDRLAKGVRTAPRDAMIADATEAADRGYAFAFHRGLDHLGAAVGPLLAAALLLLAPGNLRLVFALATLPALAGFLAVLLGTSDRAALSRPPPVPAAPALPARRAGHPAALLAFFLVALGTASDAFLLFRAGSVGLTVLELTLLWSAVHVVKWLASAPSGRLADRLGRRRLVLAGWTVAAAVALGFAAAASSLAIWALFLVSAVASGLVEGAERALIVDLAGPGAGFGTSLGTFHLVKGMGSVAAGLLFGALWQLVSAAAAFTGGAVLIAAGAVILSTGLRLGARSQR